MSLLARLTAHTSSASKRPSKSYSKSTLTITAICFRLRSLPSGTCDSLNPKISSPSTSVQHVSHRLSVAQSDWFCFHARSTKYRAAYHEVSQDSPWRLQAQLDWCLEASSRKRAGVFHQPFVWTADWLPKKYKTLIWWWEQCRSHWILLQPTCWGERLAFLLYNIVC